MARQFDAELFAGFIEETTGYLPTIRQNLEDYFQDAAQLESLQQAYRLTHNIKGASSMIGFAEVCDTASRVEQILDELASGARPLDEDVAVRLLTDFNALENQLHELALSLSPAINSPTMTAGENAEEAWRDAAMLEANADAIASLPSPPNTEQSSPLAYAAAPESDQASNADELAAVDPEMLEVFQEEADDHLRVISAGLTTFETEPDNRAVLQEVRRSTHTLKGAAGVVGLRTVSRVAHRMEDLLDRLYEGNNPVEAETLTLLLRSTDIMESLAHGASPTMLRAKIDELHTGYTALLNQLPSVDALYAAPTDTATTELLSDPPSSIDLESPGILNQEISSSNVETYSADSNARQFIAAPQSPDSDLRDEPAAMPFAASSVEEKNADEPRVAPRKSQSARRVVRVPLERLDALVKLVGELVINRTALEQRMTEVHRELKELQHSTERLRRVSTKLETEYEASSLRSGAERFTQFAGTPGALRLPEAALASINAQLDSLNFLNSSAWLNHNAPPDSATGGARHALSNFSTLPPSSTSQFPAPDSTDTSSAHGFDELEFDRYTEFHRLSRELAETSSDTNAVHDELSNLLGDFEGLLTRQRRLTNEIQERLMRVRMIPLGALAARLQRTVRVTADAEAKLVDFRIEGEHVELDTTVLDQMADPLLHILRNAVGHGIEHADVRRAIGKNERGTIKLRAAYEGTQVLFEISDDGAGIDPAAVRVRALEAGFISDAQAAAMTDKEILALIFLPGLSTAREVSELSGRGVGMDVVKEHVIKLQGTLDLESTPGQGVRFSIRLPLTLAATRALIVKAHNEIFAIPVNAVQQITRLDANDIERVRQEQTLRTNDATYPVTYLTRWLELTDGEFGEGASRAPVLILNTAGRRAALIVDEIIEGREIIIKTFGSNMRRVRGVMGATVLGDGRVIPILNPDDIVRGSEIVAVASSVQASAQRPARASQTLKRGCSVMIVDDSPSVRRVMSNLIKNQEWTALAAKDGLDALEILHNSSADALPDVILLDVEMPRMDGYELLATLRQQQTVRHIPVVMITSRTGEKHRRKALDLGASEYLTKPYQDETLLDYIRRLTAQLQA